jgi:NADH-quinone oxidoreductase subunit J
MIIQALSFYLFAFVAIAAAVMVISARNPVHSVLFLILAFFNAAGLFVLIGAEFIAMILIVVYVGAVAVLFLFVVMMLDISFSELRQGFLQYLPIGGLVGIVLLAELLMIGGSWVIAPATEGVVRGFPAPPIDQITNTHAIGKVLYTDFIYLFQGAGMVLLVAMIGAIVLTLRSRPGVRKQKISDQINRRPEDAIEIKKVQSGSGI